MDSLVIIDIVLIGFFKISLFKWNHNFTNMKYTLQKIIITITVLLIASTLIILSLTHDACKLPGMYLSVLFSIALCLSIYLAIFLDQEHFTWW